MLKQQLASGRGRTAGSRRPDSRAWTLYHWVHLSHDGAPATELDVSGQTLLRGQKWPQEAVSDLSKNNVRAVVGTEPACSKVEVDSKGFQATL